MADAMYAKAEEYLNAAAEEVTAYITASLSGGDEECPGLTRGMLYSVQAGGKRIRPALTLLVCEMLGGERRAALPSAAAIEMIHTYSLIHDDLPCMDDDDYRRGRLSNHKVFGEVNAVLAGDALLTAAFGRVADNDLLAPTLIRRQIGVLSDAAGYSGMVGGQYMDMNPAEVTTLDRLRRLQRLKTGALLRAAAQLGSIAAGITEGEAFEAVTAYADDIGLSFQIVDDLLDRYGDAAAMGKATGSDQKDGKVTFLSYLSRTDAEHEAQQLTERAKRAVGRYDADGLLSALADMLCTRTY